MSTTPVTDEEREKLAQEIEARILETVNECGYRNGPVVQAAVTAAAIVAARVTERKAVEQ